MTITEGLYRSNVKGITQSVGDHYSLCTIREGCIKLSHVDVVSGEGDIHEDRYGAVLDDWSDRGWEAGRHGNDFIAALNAALPQFRRGQCHEGKEIRRRSGIDEGAVLH